MALVASVVMGLHGLTRIEDLARGGLTVGVSDGSGVSHLRFPIVAEGAFDEKTLVPAILKNAQGAKIRRLVFLGHGTPGRQAYGRNSSLEVGSTQTFAALEDLRGAFTPDGMVVLEGCRAGLGEPGEALLSRLASALRVPVVAKLGYNHAVLPGFEGGTYAIATWQEGRVSVKYSGSGLSDPIFLRMEAREKTDARGLAEAILGGRVLLDRHNVQLVIAGLLQGPVSRRDSELAVGLFELQGPADARSIYKHLALADWEGHFEHHALSGMSLPRLVHPQDLGRLHDALSRV